MPDGAERPPAAPKASALDDVILPFRIERTGLHGRLVRLGPVVDEILSRHRYREPVAALLGEALALTCTLGASLKFDGIFTLQTKGDGPVRLLVADVTSAGGVRGYAEADDEQIAAIGETLPDNPVPRLLGAGHLAFTVDQGPDTDRYQGVVELTGASLTECASHYLRQSEQLETLLNLGVSRKSGEWRAYGLMVQKPPRPRSDFENSWDIAAEDEDAADDWLRTASLVSTLSNDEGLDPAVSPEQLLFRLFHEDGVRVMEPRPLAFRCRCSRDKVVNTLRMLDRAEVAEMKVGDAVEVTCQFCNETYRFTDDELEAVYAGDEGD
jgi:molecular chaperone Hsp33